MSLTHLHDLPDDLPFSARMYQGHAMMIERFTVFSNTIDGTHSIQDDGKHYQSAATRAGAADLAAILNAIAELAERSDAIVRDNPAFQREIIAHSIAKTLGFRAEKAEG